MNLIWLALAWFAGLALAAALRPAWSLALVLAATAAASLVLSASGPGGGRLPAAARRALVLGLVLCLGLARSAWAERPLPADHVAQWNDRDTLTLRGRIGAEPVRRDRGVDYRVDVVAVGQAGGWTAARGRVLVQGPRHPLHGYGATVLVTGTLKTPPQLETFDYRAYLAQRDIHSLLPRARLQTLVRGGGNPLRRALLAVKDRARQGLAASLPEPECSLATGILLGDDKRIPRRVADAFQRTNTTHVIAISGSNIALLVAALSLSLGRLLGRRRAFPLILVTVALYTALVGADAAVTRAAVMGGIMLLGGHLGRPGHAATALCAAAWAMTLYRPGYLWDLGFQLSFAATAGLIAFASWFSASAEARLAALAGVERGRAALRLVNEAVLVTLAAQLTTWPLIAFHTGQVSLVGLAANFLILPAQPPVMGLGALAALAGSLSPPAGRLLGALAWLPLAWTIRVVEAMAALPLAAVTWHMGPGPLVAYYAALAVVVAWRHAPARAALFDVYPGLASRIRPRLGLSALPKPPLPPLTLPGPGLGPPARRLGGGWPLLVLAATACVLTWVAALGRPDGRLHLYALDVGQGDALLVVTPNGRRMLVDGGPQPSVVLDQLGRRLPPWDRRLDLVVLSHPDADHVGGLPAVLERYRVGHVLDPDLAAESADAEAWRALRAAVAETGAEVHLARSGGRLILDEAAGVWADILWPPDPLFAATDRPTNDNSVVLRLVYGQISFLLTGDLEAAAEAALLERGFEFRASVLKVGHHGSASSTTPALLAAVSPWAALVSAGAENRYGHPAPEVLERLAALPVWRTDQRGTVEVVTDGLSVWLR